MREPMLRERERERERVWGNINFGDGIKSRVEEIIDTPELLAQQRDALEIKEGIEEKLSQKMAGDFFSR